jgi:integrase
MAHQSNGRGSAIIKRKFRGVPLIRRALGTSDPATIEAVETMYAALYQTGKLDILEAIARRRLHPLTVLSRWRQGREVELPAADVFPLLAEAWEQWAATVPASDAHRRDIRWTGRALGIPKDATLAELPALLADYRKRCLLKASAFNHGRAHAQSFLRDTVGIAHPLYTAVRAIRSIKKAERTRGRPHTVAMIRHVRERLSALYGPEIGLMAWTMAAYGMGNKEFWTDGFDVLADRVTVYGQKRASRVRDVFRWTEVTPPVMGEKAFREALRAASDGQVDIYDLRRSFSRWMEEAGIIETNRAAYMGHGAKTMTQLYAWGELPGQLAADAVLMSRYAGENPVRQEGAGRA